MGILTIAHIVVSVALIALILVQERGGGVSGIFGGGAGGFYQARRGLEKTIFYATIALTVAFIGLAIANIIL